MTASPRRHPGFVRVTHWLTVVAFAGLLVSGVQVLLSHPRFYLGETGNVNETPLFVLPVPASRDTVPTGYDYVLADQNGWSRYLHFQSAWLLAFAGLAYVGAGLATGHVRRNLLPSGTTLGWRAMRASIAAHLRFAPGSMGDAWSYNPLQRITYLLVIFVLVPLLIWTGLAMSPAFTAIWPPTVTLLGGRHTARTLHFVLTIVLTLFVFVHLAMLIATGFTARVRAMITGRAEVRP